MEGSLKVDQAPAEAARLAWNQLREVERRSHARFGVEEPRTYELADPSAARGVVEVAGAKRVDLGLIDEAEETSDICLCRGGVDRAVTTGPWQSVVGSRVRPVVGRDAGEVVRVMRRCEQRLVHDGLDRIAESRHPGSLQSGERGLE